MRKDQIEELIYTNNDKTITNKRLNIQDPIIRNIKS